MTTLPFAPSFTPRRFSTAEFTADLQAAAHSLIPEIKRRLDPEKYRQFCIVLPSLASLSSQNNLPEDTPIRVEAILDGQTDLIEKFNQFLPEERYRVAIKPTPLRPPPEIVSEAWTEAVEFVNQIRRQDNKLLRSMLEVLNLYGRKEIGTDEVATRAVKLLKGHPQLLQELTKFLPVTEARPITAKTQEGEIGDLREEEERKSKRAKTGEEEKKNNNNKYNTGEIGDLEEEEEKKPKRAKSVEEEKNNNNYNTCQKKILKLIHQNRETATLFSPSLYIYSATLKLNQANHLPKELRTLLSRLKPIDEEAPKKKPRSKECAERPNPSYKLASAPTKNRESVLNTTLELSAEDDEAESSWGKKWEWDPVTERKNEREEDRYKVDMIKKILKSARDYAGARDERELRRFQVRRWLKEMYGMRKPGEEEIDEALKEDPNMAATAGLGRIHLRRCMEAMYGEDWTEEEIEMGMENGEFVRVVVKKRVLQKLAELKSTHGDNKKKKDGAMEKMNWEAALLGGQRNRKKRADSE